MQKEKEILTYADLKFLVELDTRNHPIRAMAILLLSAMKDWPDNYDKTINVFVSKFESYYTAPITLIGILSKELEVTPASNVLRHKAGNSIIELIELSARHYKESDLNKIIANILKYYNKIIKSINPYY